MNWKRAIKWQVRDRDVIMERHLSLRQEELTGRLWLDLIRLELFVTPSPEGHPRLLPLPLTLELVSAQISPELQTDTDVWKLQRKDTSQLGQSSRPLRFITSFITILHKMCIT